MLEVAALGSSLWQDVCVCVVRVWGVCGVRGCSVVQPAPGHLTVTSTVILLNSEMPQLRHRVLCLWGSTVGSGGEGGRGGGA